MSSWDAARKKAKEEKDADEAAQLQGQRTAEAMTAEQKRTIAEAEKAGKQIDARVVGGTINFDKEGIQNVRVINDLSASGGGGLPPDVVESFKNAISALSHATAEMSAAGSRGKDAMRNLNDMANRGKTAVAEISEIARKLEGIFRGRGGSDS